MQDTLVNECHLALREGDIVLASFPKCGSTWMQYTVLALLSGGGFDGITPHDQAPFIDPLLKLGERKKKSGMQTIEKVQAALDAGVLGDQAPPNRRVFKTHRPVDGVLWDGGVHGITQGAKIILLHRNPKDVAVSWFHQSVAQQRYSPDSFEEFIRHFLSAEVNFYPKHGSFWLWYQNWWKFAENNPAVLRIGYEDMKRDFTAAVRSIANFLDVDASDDLVAQVAQAASFDAMKVHLAGKKVPKLRRGVAGGWRDELKGELLAKFDEVHAKNMAKIGVPFEFDFGARDHVSDVQPAPSKASDADDVDAVDLWFMQMALAEARQARAAGEVPVGCVVIDRATGNILIRGGGQTKQRRNGTKHCEMVAIDNLLREHGPEVCSRCRLYVTMEPCIMCSAALLQIGIPEVVYGARNTRFGGCGGMLPINKIQTAGHMDAEGDAIRCKISGFQTRGGLLADEIQRELHEFYETGNPSAPEAKRHRPLKREETVQI